MKQRTIPYHIATHTIDTNGNYLTYCHKWVDATKLVGKHMGDNGYLCSGCRNELRALANEPPTEPIS